MTACLGHLVHLEHLVRFLTWLQLMIENELNIKHTCFESWLSIFAPTANKSLIVISFDFICSSSILHFCSYNLQLWHSPWNIKIQTYKTTEIIGNAVQCQNQVIQRILISQSERSNTSAQPEQTSVQVHGSTGCPKRTLTLWFHVSWKRLYLHNLFLYFLNRHTST